VQAAQPGRTDQDFRMMQRMYAWMMGLAASQRAPHALFGVSFIESSFFPIPPDLMLIPMVLADRKKAWWYATIATVGSVLGGLLGYAIGFFLLEAVGKPILAFYGKADSLVTFKQLFQDYGVQILLIKGMTPIPYKVLTISAGVAGMALPAFVSASIVARAMRFFLVAGLLYFFGEPIKAFIEKRLTLVTTVFVVMLVSGFVAVKYLA
jgi:membrane protein YqaA with SNARE-associated domain